MKELIRSNDPVRLSRAAGLLEAEGIPSFELDGHMSILDGSIGILPRRLMVADRDHFMALAILRDHDLIDG
ncbi:DUF2007 domain-containing protein [Paracoccus sp. S-4012]|uniref:putative signal transducing protein n=1 Tax=Paracoccus sp. S-4012 TaxID=2665648 RepID=UPI0012B0BB0A|nr:DUF2007 domain-containing protein [Paracoccus sp. S-4012]MRX49115.1 DUF2007 domain-containing protein [Paracoccus sp. S-4012]